MNHVFLSGKVEQKPFLVSKEQQVPHAQVELTIFHRTVSGQEKKETFTLNAWNNVALSMMNKVRAGANMSVKGYLSIQRNDHESKMEVTVEEFQVSSQLVSRPERRNSHCSWSARQLKPGTVEMQVNERIILSGSEVSPSEK